MTLCSSCGHGIKCNNCDIKLVFHKKKDKLICHHCGLEQGIISVCSNCKKKGTIISIGFGIEKITEEVRNYFNNEKIVSLSSDTFNNKTFAKILKDIEEGSIKIIIGTQIVSKGFNFQKLDSVFVLDFDMWSNNADIRTNEKIFQLAQQVSGRTSRGDKTGEVFIQTYDLDNPLLKYLIDYKRNEFYNNELILRKNANLPPYTKLIAILLKSKNIKNIQNTSMKIKKLLGLLKEIKVFGPIPAPVEYIKNEYRYRILIKTNHPQLVQSYLRNYNISDIVEYNTKIKIDVDPISFF